MEDRAAFSVQGGCSLEALNLSCVRGDRPLFRGLAFALEPGQLLHVTGPNGSGKTTLLRTLCGLTRQAEGHVRWNGADIHELGDEYRMHLAYVGHNNGLLGELTAVENLRAAACLAGGEAGAVVEAALEQTALMGCRDLPAKVLSQGQKRRLALARLGVMRRPLWVLDEPLSGLDVGSVERLAGLFTEHLARGGMIVLTSHQEFTLEAGDTQYLRLDAPP